MHKSLHVYVHNRSVYRRHAVLSHANIRHLLFKELIAKHHPYDLANLSDIREYRNITVIDPLPDSRSDEPLSDPE
jgi:hypothetical protein